MTRRKQKAHPQPLPPSQSPRRRMHRETAKEDGNRDTATNKQHPQAVEQGHPQQDKPSHRIRTRSVTQKKIRRRPLSNAPSQTMANTAPPSAPTMVSWPGKPVSLLAKPCTVIQEKPEYMLRLQSFVAAQDVLRQTGYVLEPLSKENLEEKKRCQGCGKQMSKILRGKARWLTKSDNAAGEGKKPAGSGAQTHPSEKRSLPQREEGAEKLGVGRDSDAPTFHPKNTFPCKFHDGCVVNKMWTCCRKHVSLTPCTGAEQHHPRLYAPGEIDRLWQFHATPTFRVSLGPSKVRRVVAIDCEMGTAASGDSELIRLTLIDYFSSSTLIDSLVYPSVPMRDYRTRFSGVTRRDMEAARRWGRCIMGRDNARRTVWEYVARDTVVVGHSPNNDLAALRWIHDVVVDTYLIEKSALAIKKKNEEKENEKENEKKESGTHYDNTENTVKQGDDTDIGTDGKKGHKNNAVAAAAEALGQLSLSSPLPPKPTRASETRQSQLQQTDKKQGPKERGILSLKTLALTRLGREIQSARAKGHDSLEDAIAARDLAHWWVVQGSIRNEQGFVE